MSNNPPGQNMGNAPVDKTLVSDIEQRLSSAQRETLLEVGRVYFEQAHKNGIDEKAITPLMDTAYHGSSGSRK